MNFKNRLEALKWMCENVGAVVFFDFENEVHNIFLGEGASPNTSAGDYGTRFFKADAINFRTTPEYTPDLIPEPRFPWLETCNFIRDTDNVTAKQLIGYHNALIKFLDERYKK
jgi:hypothetical protein